MLDALLTGAVVGLASAGFALVFRALPWPERWLTDPRWFWQKFWHCTTCAPTRVSLLVAVIGALQGAAWWATAAGLGWWGPTFIVGTAWAVGTYVYSFAAPPMPMPAEAPAAPVETEWERRAKTEPSLVVLTLATPHAPAEDRQEAAAVLPMVEDEALRRAGEAALLRHPLKPDP